MGPSRKEGNRSYPRRPTRYDVERNKADIAVKEEPGAAVGQQLQYLRQETVDELRARTKVVRDSTSVQHGEIAPSSNILRARTRPNEAC